MSIQSGLDQRFNHRRRPLVAAGRRVPSTATTTVSSSSAATPGSSATRRRKDCVDTDNPSRRQPTAPLRLPLSACRATHRAPRLARGPATADASRRHQQQQHRRHRACCTRMHAHSCPPTSPAPTCHHRALLRPPALAPGPLRSPGAFKRRRTSLAATSPASRHSSAAAALGDHSVPAGCRCCHQPAAAACYCRLLLPPPTIHPVTSARLMRHELSCWVLWGIEAIIAIPRENA